MQTCREVNAKQMSVLFTSASANFGRSDDLVVLQEAASRVTKKFLLYYTGCAKLVGVRVLDSIGHSNPTVHDDQGLTITE
ncbi:hypothetical protein RUM44_003679 [Polyplax serrata]|uniref:Uncharacterized protein n=1 Tax=Polyplax serrata TaxID=468196 RepID=A0ABR1AHR1_POLSC